MNKKTFKDLEQQIIAAGTAIPGTIREVFLRCGRANCVCAAGKPADRHGPYYFWSVKRGGKLTSVSIAADDVNKFNEWIENRRSLEAMLESALEAGVKEALRHQKASESGKPKKRRQSTPSD